MIELIGLLNNNKGDPNINSPKPLDEKWWYLLSTPLRLEPNSNILIFSIDRLAQEKIIVKSCEWLISSMLILDGKFKKPFNSKLRMESFMNLNEKINPKNKDTIM